MRYLAILLRAGMCVIAAALVVYFVVLFCSYLRFERGDIVMPILNGQPVAVLRDDAFSGPITELETVRIPMTVANLTSREMRIAPRPNRLEAAYIEGMPTTLGPWEAQPFDLVVEAAGRHGRQSVICALSTSDPRCQKFPFSVSLDFQVDESARTWNPLFVPPGAQVSEIIEVEDVPATAFLRIVNRLPAGWSVSKVRAEHRTLVLRLCGKVEDDFSGRLHVPIEVAFASKEVKNVYCNVVFAAAQTWIVPQSISLDPLGAPDGNAVATIVHRRLTKPTPGVPFATVASVSPEWVLASIGDASCEDKGGWFEQRCVLRVSGSSPPSSESEGAVTIKLDDSRTAVTRVISVFWIPK